MVYYIVTWRQRSEVLVDSMLFLGITDIKLRELGILIMLSLDVSGS
jgi:hypothetical protein